MRLLDDDGEERARQAENIFYALMLDAGNADERRAKQLAYCLLHHHSTPQLVELVLVLMRDEPITSLKCPTLRS